MAHRSSVYLHRRPVQEVIPERLRELAAEFHVHAQGIRGLHAFERDFREHCRMLNEMILPENVQVAVRAAIQQILREAPRYGDTHSAALSWGRIRGDLEETLEMLDAES